MSSEQFEKLMDEIKQTRAEMQEKIGKLQKEVAATQDDAAQKIVKKLGYYGETRANGNLIAAVEIVTLL